MCQAPDPKQAGGNRLPGRTRAPPVPCSDAPPLALAFPVARIGRWQWSRFASPDSRFEIRRSVFLVESREQGEGRGARGARIENREKEKTRKRENRARKCWRSPVSRLPSPVCCLQPLASSLYHFVVNLPLSVHTWSCQHSCSLTSSSLPSQRPHLKQIRQVCIPTEDQPHMLVTFYPSNRSWGALPSGGCMAKLNIDLK